MKRKIEFHVVFRNILTALLSQFQFSLKRFSICSRNFHLKLYFILSYARSKAHNKPSFIHNPSYTLFSFEQRYPILASSSFEPAIIHLMCGKECKHVSRLCAWAASAHYTKAISNPKHKVFLRAAGTQFQYVFVWFTSISSIFFL